MDADQINSENLQIKNRFKSRSDEEIEKLLEDKDKKSTQESTKRAVSKLREFVLLNQMQNIDAVSTVDLGEILYKFYRSMKPQKKDGYCVQTIKCIRPGLNRYFRKERGFDISSDQEFVKANEIFKAVCVEAK